MGRKLKHETTTRGSNGEAVTTQKTYAIKADSESFFMVFLDNMSGLLKIKNATDHRVILVLNSLAEFNTGRVLLTPEIRKKVVGELILDDQTFSNSLKRLKEAGLLDGGRGIYTINPLVFWRGTSDDRKKLLREKGMEIRLIFQPSEKFDAADELGS